MKSIASFLSLPPSGETEEGIGTVKIFNAISTAIAVFVATMLFGLVFVFIRKSGVAITTSVLILLLLLSRIAAKRYGIRSASILLTAGLWLIFTVTMWLSGGVNSVMAGFYIALTCMSGLLLGTRFLVIVAGSSIATCLVMTVLPTFGYEAPRYYPIPPWPAFFVQMFWFILIVPPTSIAIRGLSEGLRTARREIAERKKAEEDLRNSVKYNRFLANAIQFSSQPFEVRHLDGSIVMANKAYCELIGYSEEEMRRADCVKDLTPPEYRGIEASKLAELMATGKPVRYEKEYARKDGARVPVELLVHTATSETGEQVYYSFITDLTERRRAKEFLQTAHDELELRVRERTAELENAKETIMAERQRLYNVLETLPAYVCLLDTDYRMPFANRYFRETFGESHGRRCYEFLFKRNEPCETCETYVVMKTGQPHHWNWTGPNGRSYAVYDFPFLDADGSTFVLEMGIDITERKRAEDDLRESETKYKALYEGSADGIFLLDNNGTILDGNQAALSMYGYSLEEIRGTKVIDLIHPEDLELTPFKFQEMTEGRIVRIERRMRKRDGEYLHVDVTGTRVADHLLQGLYRDVTERRRAEEKLRESENRYRQMFQVNRAVKLLIDPESSEIVDANRAAADFYGYELERLKQMKITDINVLPSEDVFQKMSEAYAQEKNYFLFQHRLASGESRYVEVYSTPLDLHGKRLLYSIVHDITDRRKVEEELVRSNEDLQQFAYVASHDLQEPLRNVASCLQMLEKKYKSNLDADADKLIHYAVESSVRMKALILDLLAYSRVGTRGAPFRPVDCERTLVQVMRNLAASISETGAMITYDPLPTISADGTQLLQVFQNLIGNGLKFRSGNQPVIHVSAVKDKNEWVFSVEDNGIGIQPQHLDRIFVIFQRLNKRSQYEGTGMGLAIVKKVVERHGGRVWVESEPGVGTTFYFTIAEKGTRT